MIFISRCPSRVSLLGGGSDLDWFVQDHLRGFSIGFSIQVYSRVIVGKRQSNFKRGLLNYSSREEYKTLDSISHPIIRSSLKHFSITNPIELTSFGDVSLGGGLATSSSFCVALLSSLSKMIDKNISNIELAKLASDVEIDVLKNPIGRQDQYLCALGGVNFLEFKKDGFVKQNYFPNISQAINQFSKELFICDSSIYRSASKTLSNIKNDNNSVESIIKIRDIADDFIINSSRSDDINKIISNLKNSLEESWQIKKSLVGVMNKDLEEIEQFLSKNNFQVFKLLGAGGGGYFLVGYNGSDLNKDLKALKKSKIVLTSINIDNEGCKSWII